MSKKVIPFPGRATTTRLADPRRLEFEHAGEQIAAIPPGFGTGRLLEMLSWGTEPAALASSELRS